MGGFSLDKQNNKSKKQELHMIKDAKKDISDVFEPKRVANFSDDALGVLGWKGTGLLFIILAVGFGLFKVFFH